MTWRSSHTMVMKISPKHIAASLAAPLTILCAPLAHADQADNQFVDALNAAGVPGNRTAEIAIAHESCGLTSAGRLGFGGMPAPAQGLLIKIRNELLDQGVEMGTQMRAFERATNDAYCPDLNSFFTG